MTGCLTGGWQFLREGLPFGLVLLLSQMFVWIDSFLLMALLDTRAVGLYHAAYRWILLALGLVGYFPQALYPRMLRLRGSAEGIALLQNAIRLSLQLGVIAMLCLFGLSPLVVGSAFGTQYEEAQAILRTLALLLPFAMHNSLAVHHLNACHRESSAVGISGAAVVVNAILNVVLIVRMGIAGAAWALVLTEMIVFVISAVTLVNKGLPASSTFRTLWLALLPTIFVLQLVPAGPALRAGAALATFTAMLFLTGELSATRLKEYHTMFLRVGA